MHTASGGLHIHIHEFALISKEKKWLQLTVETALVKASKFIHIMSTESSMERWSTLENFQAVLHMEVAIEILPV